MCLQVGLVGDLPLLYHYMNINELEKMAAREENVPAKAHFLTLASGEKGHYLHIGML